MNDEMFAASLSRREKDVVDLLMLGKSNKQIAHKLGISERTVEFHLNNVYSKLQVGSRMELALKLVGASGARSGNQVESTVDSEWENAHNGNQSAQLRAEHSWRNVFSLIKREVAMTLRISFQDLEDYLQQHPDIFAILVFLSASLTLRYVVFGAGLYFWVSYLLLELLLLFASVRFGELVNGTWHSRPILIILIAAILPLLVLFFDQLYLYTFLRYSGFTSVSLPSLCATAEWLMSPDGTSYLSTQLSITSDFFWFVAIAEILGVFLLSRILGKRPEKSNLAHA